MTLWVAKSHERRLISKEYVHTPVATLVIKPLKVV